MGNSLINSSLDRQLPLVTVITVTYNSSLFVRDTIKSVLSQSYTHIQYLIGDDCSGDETWKIINEYNDPRIIKYRNENNLGEYQNRNKAITMASGKYLIFIDGDDIIYPHGIGYFVEMLERFPEAALAVQKGYLNNMLFPALLFPEESVSNYFFGKENLLSSSFVSDFYRTDALNKSGLLKTNYIGGDNEIRLRIAAGNPILLIAGWVSWARETPGQASSKISLTTHMVENFYLIRELESISDPRFIKPQLIEEIKKHGKKIISRYVLRSLAKGRIGAAGTLLKRTGISLSEVGKYWKYNPSCKDFIEAYTPSSPFKRGFLKEGLEVIVS